MDSSLDKSRPVSSQAAGREEQVGKAARKASFRFSRHFGSFLYEGRKKPHVIREYGREPTEIIFETDDRFECSNELQRIEDEFVGRAALEAATEYRNQVIRDLMEKAEAEAEAETLLGRYRQQRAVVAWLKAQMEVE